VKTAISSRVGRLLGDEMRFFKNWLGRPRSIGAVMPSSPFTARSMASVANPDSQLPVLELGPGTGVVTSAILERGIAPNQLWSIEYAPEFFNHLKNKWPDIKLVLGDAFNLDATLGDGGAMRFDCAISGLPLLNFPMHQRIDFLNGLLKRLPAGRPVIQLCYGFSSPIDVTGTSIVACRRDFVLRNVPPAHIWSYHLPRARS